MSRPRPIDPPAYLSPEEMQAWHQRQSKAKEDSTLFRSVDLSNLAQATAPHTDYALERLLPRRHVTLLGGHGGIGKTTLALTLGAHVVCGRDWAGLPAAKQRVLYLSMEDPGRLIKARLRNIATAYALPFDWLEEAMDIRDGTFSDCTLAIEANDFGTRHLVPTAAMGELQALLTLVEYGLVIVDNASDGFAGDENNRRQVRQFMRWLANIARDTDVAILLLVHIDKHAAKHGGAGNSYSGSTAWHNTARSRLALIDRDGVPVLLHEKHNLGRLHTPTTLAFNDHGVLVPARMVSKEPQADDCRVVLEGIRQAIDMGATVTAALSGPSTAFHAIEPHLPDDFTKDRQAAKRRVFATILTLLRDGKLVKASYLDSRRKRKSCLALEQPDGPEIAA